VIYQPTIYIDPGVQYFAWALINENRELELCGKTSRECIAEIARYASRVEIERPWGKGKRTTQADIDDLNIAVGEYGGHFKVRKYRRPYTAPKELRHERAFAALRPHELARLPKFKTHLHHVGCAVYMGMRDTGRLVA